MDIKQTSVNGKICHIHGRKVNILHILILKNLTYTFLIKNCKILWEGIYEVF